MAVRPVEFQGMIQNTQELSSLRSNEQQRPLIQQENAATANQQAVETSNQQVGESEQSGENKFDPSRGGDGTGYAGNRGGKKDGEKKKAAAKPEGVVRIKNGHKSFEVTV